MNREIKFRGKRPDNGEWVYGYYVVDPKGQHKIYWQPFPEATSNTYHIVDPKSVGQYTGLKDKNGKEIYEKDVVKAKWSRASTGGYFQSSDAYCETELTLTVKWVENGFYYVRSDGKRASIPKDAKITIIGNAIEHPELLTTTL